MQLTQHELNCILEFAPYPADLSGFDLSELDLDWLDLTGACLIDADLSYASLCYANLQRANLEGANLQRANLIGANLDEASLRGANLRRASLRDANLAGADFQDADLTGASLLGARLEEANLVGAILVDTLLDTPIGMSNRHDDIAKLWGLDAWRLGCFHGTTAETLKRLLEEKEGRALRAYLARMLSMLVQDTLPAETEALIVDALREALGG
jgi:hypothetical protein